MLMVCSVLGLCSMLFQGGFVECRKGVWRVLGSLAVSRAIGDQYLKQWVTAEPETKVVKLDPEYEFLLLASDGLWDKVTINQSSKPFCCIASHTSSHCFEPISLMQCWSHICTILDVLQVSNQEAIDIARPFCIDVEEPQPLSACRKLVDLSVSRGSADDISVMLIQLWRFH